MSAMDTEARLEKLEIDLAHANQTIDELNTVVFEQGRQIDRLTRKLADMTDQMEELIPWKRLEGKIRKYYPQPGNGRRPYELSTMLRVHCMQLFYNLSDPAMEDALIEVPTMRRFAGIELISDRITDETTILTFRHLLEKHWLDEKILETVNAHIAERSMSMRPGTIGAATLIAMISSNNNKEGKQDQEMHQTKKMSRWSSA